MAVNGYSKFWNLRACLEGLIVNTATVKAVTANSIAIEMAVQAAAHLSDLFRPFKFGSQNANGWSIAGYSGPLVSDLTTQGFGNIHRNIAEIDGYVALLNNLAAQTNSRTFSDPASVEAYYETMWPILRAELLDVASQIGA